MSPTFPTAGSHALTGVAGLPNVSLAHQGEHWSNRIASGSVVPGEAVVPVNSGGKLAMRTAGSGDAAELDRIAIALRPIDVPDINPGSQYVNALSPNDIKNLVINPGEYVHAYYSGVFHLTLVTPAVYVPTDRIGWDADGVRPAGKAGVGAWAKNASADLDSVFEVMEFREVNALHEGILTVRFIGRSQF